MLRESLQEIIARHRAFWMLADVDRPLLGGNVDLPAVAKPPASRINANIRTTLPRPHNSPA
jgi:hypothetical protein